MTGFNSKRNAAADKLQEPVNLLEARRIAAEYGTPNSQVDDGNLYFALSKCLEHIDARPAQEPDALTIAYQSGFYDGKKAAQRPWVGLTPEDTEGFTSQEKTLVKYVSKVLLEKNG